MSDTPKPPQQPANLTSLQRELLNLAARGKPTCPPCDRRQQAQGPVLVIRGK
jgi:hypothetical protein